MANRVPLNNVEHHQLRVAVRHGAEFGDAVNQLLLFPNEFEEAQREFPILFRRDDQGRWHSVALLGFEKGENLFLGEGRWRSRYVPAVQRRGPFFIGPAPESDEAAGAPPEPAIYIDLDDPRVSESEGEPLFLPHGGNAPYLEHVGRALDVVRIGMRVATTMFDLFEDIGLIEPIAISVETGDGTTYDIPNFHTISARSFASLGGPELERLNRSGFLASAVYVRSSLGNVQRLVDLKSGRAAV